MVDNTYLMTTIYLLFVTLVMETIITFSLIIALVGILLTREQ